MFDYHKPEGAPIDWWKGIPDMVIPYKEFIWLEHINYDGEYTIQAMAGWMDSIPSGTTLQRVCEIAAGKFAGEQREIFRITKTPELIWEIHRGEIILPTKDPKCYVTALTLLALEREDWEVLRYANYLNRSHVSFRYQSDFQFYWEDVCLSEPETVISIFNPRIPLTDGEVSYLTDRLDRGGAAERWRWEDAEGNLTNESMREALSLRFLRRKRNERFSK